MAAKKVVSGVFGGKGTAAWKDWDAMHTFSRRKKDGFGGKVHSGAGYAGNQVPDAMQAFYKTEKLNPCITSIKITVDPVAWTVSWEVTIEESPDGKAYVGFNSWGGAAGGYPAKSPPGSWAYTNYQKEVKDVIGRYPGADPRNVIDFYFPGGFRQIFFQYTIPNKFPNLPMSANARKGSVGVDIGPSGSPKGLPEYNGVLFPTVKYTDPDPNANQPISTSASTAEQATQQQPQEEPVAPYEPADPRLINGQIILKVKSGPGVIIGDTEVPIVDGVANFTGIQFDTPGDYVISVASNHPDIDSAATEIKIKVTPEPEAIPQEPKGNTASEPAGPRPIIAQIDQVPKEVQEVKKPRQGANNQDAASVAGHLGNTIFMDYNGTHINDRDIVSMNLYHDGMIPKVDVTFNDTNGMITKEPPRDETNFDIFINSRSENLKSIHLKMRIVDYKRISNNQYQFFGAIDIPQLYRMKFKVYRGTSFNVLREICKDLQIGFNSNIDDTKDEMPWRNVGDKQFKFLEEVVKHSYISDTSFMAGYIDYYYCFNYVDVEKEMNRDISKDSGIDTGGFQSSKTDADKIVPLTLISDPGMQSSSMFFVKTGERSEATKTSMEQGYKTRTKFYDKVKKMFLVFDVDSTTSDASKTIINKGGSQEAFDNNYVTKYEGKIDTDNTHKNYNYAVTQNRINLDNMVKNQMDITLPNPNFNLYKYMKINATVIKANATPGAPERAEWRWSGDWLISDISFTFTNGKLEQKVTLVRKEMGKDPEEIKNPDGAGKKEERTEKNENPIVGSQSSAIAKPNEIYKPGEEYTVEDPDGKRYVIKISSLLENGNEIKAEIRDIDYVYSAVVTNPESVSGMSASSAGTSGTSGTAGTSGTTASVGPSYYPYEVNLRKVDYTYGSEMPQSFVTAKANSYWKYIIAAASYRNPLQLLSSYESREVYIAIKRPIPDFKPQKEEKDETPYSWVLFELKDLGVIEPGTDSYDKLKDTTIEKYEVSRSRLLDSNDRGIEDWRVSKGYVKILNSAGEEVWSSENDSVMETTGEYDIASGRPYGIGDPKYDYGWFKSKDNNTDQDLIPKDQLYTYVGGPNTIFIDMSNPAKFPAGTYTLELKYNVPLYEKLNSGGENDGKPYDGKGAFYTRTERLRAPIDDSGNSPCEAKILRETFTISKRSQRR